MSGKYSEMLRELQEIVDRLSREDCPVDDLEELVQRASTLIGALRKRLERTEESVKGILTEIGE